MASDPDHPIRFKITSKADPTVYGWISKVIELEEDRWQDSFLYGFYRYGSFRNKYPVSFNIQSRMMRGTTKRNAEKNPKQMVYFRNVFGILDLEPEASVLDFIFSWLWSVKFQHIWWSLTLFKGPLVTIRHLSPCNLSLIVHLVLVKTLS